MLYNKYAVCTTRRLASLAVIYRTLYIRIAMVFCGTFGPCKNQFQIPLNFTSTNIKVKNMLKANDIKKQIKKLSCKIHVMV